MKYSLLCVLVIFVVVFYRVSGRQDTMSAEKTKKSQHNMVKSLLDSVYIDPHNGECKIKDMQHVFYFSQKSCQACVEACIKLIAIQDVNLKSKIKIICFFENRNLHKYYSREYSDLEIVNGWSSKLANTELNRVSIPFFFYDKNLDVFNVFIPDKNKPKEIDKYLKRTIGV